MMGFLDWFRAPAEKRSITFADFGARALLDPAPSAGVLVNERTALNLRPLFQGVSIISGWVGLLPLVTYRRVAEDERERATSLPAYRILHDAPNRYMTPLVFWQTIIAHALTWGNGYAEIEFDRALRPLALWPIDPSAINPVVENNALRYDYAGRAIVPADIIHIPGLGFDGIKGYSVVRMAARSLGAAAAAEQFGASFFANGAFPGMVLEHPGQLSPEAQKRLQASWNNDLQGPYKAQRTKILEEGMKANKIGIPPEDAQFLETREFGVVDIAGWLNIGPHMLGHRPGEWPGGTPEAADRHFFTHTLLPWLVRVSQECTRKLLPSGGTYYTEHLPEMLLRMAPAEKAQNYKTYFDMGVVDAEWIARKENLPKPPAKPEPSHVDPPEPFPAPAPQEGKRMQDAFRALVVDVADRFLTREADRAHKAAKKGPDAFGAWIEAFYSAAEVDSLTERLAPVVGIVAIRRAWGDGEITAAARAIAAAHLEKSREELLDLRKDDIDGQVERLTKRWAKSRPQEMADRIAALAAEGN